MTDAGTIATNLRSAIDEGIALFKGVSEEQTAQRSAPHQWCAREVIGHLIDSACNNDRRFIINQNAERLAIESYDQTVWVARQRYADIPVSELVPMWAAYNRHIARVIEGIPDSVLNQGRGSTDDYRFAYLGQPAAGPATLRHLAEDYVGHIRHHFHQVRRLLRG